ncbi:MAG: hypothetical protein Q8L39_02270 [Burkholderiales bacterium]|nr:hypothetical protein [Burkholderiales bacterium]
MPTDQEIGLLPPYCLPRLHESQNLAAAKVWRDTLGPSYNHLQHYCMGLNLINRSFRISSQKDRAGGLEAALNEIDYTLKNASPDFSLLPDIYFNHGVANSYLKRDAEALKDLSKAIEKNPRLVKAYNLMADIYEGIKQKQKALESVTLGLQHNPDAKSLQKRYRDLGGKLPYPEPILPAQVEAAKPAEPVANEPAPKKEVEASKPVSASGSAEEDTVAQPKIGSPKNPYCRFCQD